MCINRVRELDDNRGTKARNTFEKCRYANHPGLCPEKIALTGEQIGNFPQVFSHLSLMDAAGSLNEAPPTALRRSGRA
jgi:GH15 family glucan-1,4-alpha-glucosidase